jgi:hypothetical protein
VVLDENFRKFVAYALARNLMNISGQLLNRSKGFPLDCVVETGSKSHGAQHAKFVFNKALPGIADGAHDLGVQVFSPTNEVEHLVADRIEQ